MKSKCAEPDPRPYRGRFAPTPSGPLHLGSLVAAVGSYLDAKAHHGTWLLRIEDIDPPREMPGAAGIIQRQLEAHGLWWDESVRYQSEQSALYDHNLQQLICAGYVYACDCTRKQIRARAPQYTGFCRARRLPVANNALRFTNDTPFYSYQDCQQGEVSAEHTWAAEDFILKRRDGLWAYQLAVVSDDRDQGITHIVRGSDLMVPTLWQLSLWQRLNEVATLEPLPSLRHLPLLTDTAGRKLSKQNHAPAIHAEQAVSNLAIALRVLGLRLPEELHNEDVHVILTWAIQAWSDQIKTDHLTAGH